MCAQRIRESGEFPYDSITDLQIVSALEPANSETSFDVYVNAHLIGAILGINKRQVFARVNLDLELDRNLLSESVVVVQHVDIMDHVLKEGLTPDAAANLLSSVL